MLFTELFALQVYCPSSVLVILLRIKNAAVVPEIFTLPSLTHVTSGAGFPNAVQLIVTEDPSR